MSELQDLLDRVGWKGRELARRLDIPRGTVGDMVSGRMTAHPSLIDYLNRVAKAIERIDPPERVDRRWRDD
jgi:plasmid maintenance system antidote protein VapI